MKRSSCLSFLIRVMVVSLVVAYLTSPAVAVVVESQSANTEVILDATGAGLVMEDPPVGTMYLECTLLEWRDADDVGAPDWTPSGTVDGSTTQAWLRNAGAQLTTTTTVASDAVTFNLEGDSNDGRVRLFVDGSEVAVIDMFDAGNNRVIVIVRNLPMTTHTLLIDDIGQSNIGTGDDIAVYGGAAIQCVLNPPDNLMDEAGFTKDRYISFNPNTNGALAVATRVTRVGSITDKYVDCTSLQNEGADGWYATLIDGPLPAPPDATYYCNLSGVTTGLHVRGCSVVPGNSYIVEMTIDGLSFSAALSIPTTPPQAPSREFGDTVGSFVGIAWTAPEGIVTTNDIVAAVSKFRLDPNAPIIARVDTDGRVPNAVVSSGDILRAVRAFEGDPFGFGVTDCPTGTCVPPQGGLCE